MPSFKISDQRMNTGGSPGGLSPVGINGMAGGGMQTTRVNPNAANTTWTNQAVPQIVPDESVSHLGAFAESATKAAFQYQERVDAAEADQRMLNLNGVMRDAYDTLSGQSGEAGVKGYTSFEGVVKSSMADALADAPEAVRAKMALGVHRTGDEYLSNGSRHRAKEQAVWEQNIFENKMSNARNEMLAQSSQPEEFVRNLEVGLAVIDGQFAGQPEVATQQKRAMTEDAFLSAAAQQSDLGQFVKAVDYIVTGQEAYGVDSAKSAKALDQVSKAMHSANSRAITAGQQAKQDEEARRELENKNLLNQADQLGDRSVLEGIADPMDRAKFESVFDKLQKDAPTSPEGQVELNLISQTTSANPQEILTHSFTYPVSMQDRLATMNRVRADNKAGRTAQISEANEVVESLIQLPPEMQSIKMATGSDAQYSAGVIDAVKAAGYDTLADARAGLPVMEKAIADTQSYWRGRMTQAIRDSKDNPNEGPETALLRVKNEMADSFKAPGLNSQNWSAIEVPKEALSPILNMPSGDGGLMPQMQLVGSPAALDRVGILEAYQDSMLDLLVKYGQDVNDLDDLAKVGTSTHTQSLLVFLLKNPDMRRQAMRDIYQLKLQRQYLIQNEGTPTSATPESPNIGDDNNAP